ncbi:MAG: xanthine dehydrogenase family protein subunit M [Alphaproteobacteria bacterium]|nr:xanthine dehydrogenase family protein subunit M [Alphaproteobacteria bacterium]
MKPPPFDYVVADSVEAAVALLGQSAGEAKIIAGGQSLVPMLNFRLLRPALLVDINAIAALSFVEDAGHEIRIGALTRHRQLETSPVIATHLPVIAEAMGHVAHLAIRNRGTIGGSLSHADPAAELPMLALLLDARLEIASGGGRRDVAAGDFFRGALSVALDDGELLTEIRIPKLPAATGWGFAEVARRHGDFALAAIATTLTVADGTAVDARIAMTGVADRPLRATVAERLLLGQAVTADLLERVAAVARESVTPGSDVHASADYRRHLVGVLVRRAMDEAWRRAQRGAA